MRRRPRFMATGVLLVVVGVIAAQGSAPAASGPGGSAFTAGRLFPAGLAAPSTASSTLQTDFFAGYATFLGGSTTTSATFTIPQPNCATSDSGVGPGVFVNAGDAGQSLDAAGVLDQCVGGVVTIAPALVVGNVTTSFANEADAGDTMQAAVTVGGSGTTVTLTDLTPPRAFTLTMTGTDNISADETIGTFTTSVKGVGVPVGAAAPATFTAATVNGAPIGTQSPFRVLLTDGCNVVLRPSPVDAATHASFTVSEPAAQITSLNPMVARTGTSVEIDGAGFNGTSTVTFGTAPATQVVHDSATMLHATVPSAAITAPVTIKNTAAPRGRFTSACTFTVLPKITSFTPHSGITGSVLTINGSGLTPGPQVIFPGAAAGKILSESPDQLRVRVSDGAMPGPVRLETAAGSATTSNDFVPTLSLTSFAPASGPPGTSVSITGIGFNDSSTVKFHGVPATSVTHVSSTTLIAVVPFAPTGPITGTNTTAPTGTVKSFKSFLRT